MERLIIYRNQAWQPAPFWPVRWENAHGDRDGDDDGGRGRDRGRDDHYVCDDGLMVVMIMLMTMVVMVVMLLRGRVAGYRCARWDCLCRTSRT